MSIRAALMASATLAMIGAGAQAQDTYTLPPQLEGIRGVESAGIQEGLEIFTIEGSDLIVGRAENQNDIFIGMVFDEEGDDVSAMILGKDPADLDDVFEIAGVKRDVPFSGMDEEEVTLNLEDLKVDLEGAKSQEEFLEVLQAWQAKAKGQSSDDSAGEAPAEEETPPADEKAETGNAADVVPDIAAILKDVQSISEDSAPLLEEPEAASQDEAAPLGLSAEELGDGLDETMKEAEKALSFDEQALVIYQAMSQDVSRFTMGSEDAPVIYAFLDPACIFCSRAIEKMRPLVTSGEIRLAAIPVPAVNRNSPDAVARVLIAENPAQALFDNARFVLSGGTDPLKPAKFEDLDPALKQDVAQNRQIMVDLGISQVPFFSFMTENGPTVLAGVPEDGAFDSAVLDTDQ